MDTPDSTGKIGWVGLGKMGLPICKRLRAAGYKIKAFCRSEEKAQIAASNGFEPTFTVFDTSSGCKFVGSAVSDDNALLEIVTGRDGLRQALTSAQIFIETDRQVRLNAAMRRLTGATKRGA